MSLKNRRFVRFRWQADGDIGDTAGLETGGTSAMPVDGKNLCIRVNQGQSRLAVPEPWEGWDVAIGDEE